MNEYFPDRRGSKERPARSLDLNASEFVLCSQLKSIVYATQDSTQQQNEKIELSFDDTVK